jgi:plasmid stabilization system protein ParE
MPDTYRVNLTLRAAGHLEDIHKYIEQDSADNAPRMIQRIMDAIDSLEIFPHRYKVLEQSTELGEEVRSMVVKPYLIRYHIDESNRSVTILSIRHGARKPEL